MSFFYLSSQSSLLLTLPPSISTPPSSASRGDCASLNLTNLYAKFRPGGSREPSAALGSNRDYNVDLVPKFIMACGNLVKILLHTKVREGGREEGREGVPIKSKKGGKSEREEKFASFTHTRAFSN